jgi:hypothetical protein
MATIFTSCRLNKMLGIGLLCSVLRGLFLFLAEFALPQARGIKTMTTQNPMMAGQLRPRSHSWRRFIGIVAFYGLLGPLLGAIAANGLFTLYTVGVEIAKDNFSDVARLFWGGIVVGTIISVIIAYAFGIVSAVGTGLAVALRDRRKGGISWRTAIISALVMWLLTSVAATTVVPPEGLAQWVGALLVAHLLAASFCTWAACRIFR